jgi:hypothetical protein
VPTSRTQGQPVRAFTLRPAIDVSFDARIIEIDARHAKRSAIAAQSALSLAVVIITTIALYDIGPIGHRFAAGCQSKMSLEDADL